MKAALTRLHPLALFSWGGHVQFQLLDGSQRKIVAQIFLNIFPNPHGDLHDKIKTLVYQAINN